MYPTITFCFIGKTILKIIFPNYLKLQFKKVVFLGYCYLTEIFHFYIDTVDHTVVQGLLKFH